MLGATTHRCSRTTRAASCSSGGTQDCTSDIVRASSLLLKLFELFLWTSLGNNLVSSQCPSHRTYGLECSLRGESRVRAAQDGWPHSNPYQPHLQSWDMCLFRLKSDSRGQWIFDIYRTYKCLHLPRKKSYFKLLLKKYVYICMHIYLCIYTHTYICTHKSGSFVIFLLGPHLTVLGAAPGSVLRSNSWWCWGVRMWCLWFNPSHGCFRCLQEPPLYHLSFLDNI